MGKLGEKDTTNKPNKTNNKTSNTTEVMLMEEEWEPFVTAREVRQGEASQKSDSPAKPRNTEGG